MRTEKDVSSSVKELHRNIMQEGKAAGKGAVIMKNVLTVVVMAMLIACAGVLQAQDVSGPRIETREVNYDAGKVVQGTRVSHVFEVRNAGNEALIIDRLVPS